jgi:hypothetical protein
VLIREVLMENNRELICDDVDDVDKGDVAESDVADSYIFIDKIKPNNKGAESSWSEYIRKTYNTTSIFLGIAVIYLYFLYKKPSKSASNL